MNIILTTGILLIVLSFILKNNKKISPFWGFLMVFLIMGFQEGVEGDFMVYKAEYDAVARGISYGHITAEGEVVWLFLYSIFTKVVPFWMFIILFAGFECWILYTLGRKYGSKKYGWISAIIFFFTFYMMLIEMKALRQGLAVELMVLAYLLSTHKKGVFLSVASMVAAILTHYSALVAFPLIIYQFIISRKPQYDFDQESIGAKHSIMFPLAMVVAYFIVYSLKSSSLGDLLSQLAILGEAQNLKLSGYLESEQEYAFDISILIVLYDAVMVYLCAWFYQRTTQRNKFFAIASIIGCFGDMLLFGMGSLPRVLTFFLVYNIVTYSLMAEMISKKYGKSLAFVFIVMLIGYSIKTSLPMIIGTEGPFAFASYRFVFAN